MIVLDINFYILKERIKSLCHEVFLNLLLIFRINDD